MIKIICVGKIKERYLEELIKDYQKRITKYHKIEIMELKDKNKETESLEILNRLNERDLNILLDIEGESYSSLKLAQMINQEFNNYGTITFIIGGSDGVTEAVRKKVDKRLSFSSLTFPHGLFRGILLEQIYRAFKINNNERYHK